MRSIVRWFVSFLSIFASAAVCAEPQLYETGPSEESSYVRFVNATGRAITIMSATGSAKVELNTREKERASRFFPVKSGTKLAATIQSNAYKIPVNVVGKPWEYITIAILPNGATQVTTRLIRETPEDFNAMRSSLALFNLDTKCSGALMQGGPKQATILDNVKPFSVQRRLVNPVRLNAAIACGGSGGDTAIDLSQLQAGERYSIFLLTLNNVRQAFFVVDDK